MNLLFVGDVFGRPGRDALLGWLPGFVAERKVGFVVANGENAANGAGITSKIALHLLDAGVDVITTGNHVWRQKEVFEFLVRDERIVRPANYPEGAPGRGLTVRPARDGSSVAVIDLAGSLFMDTGLSPFRIVDRLVDQARKQAETIVVDLHAEATSEKSRWATTSTAGSRSSSARTPTCRPPTPACCPAAPRTSPTSA